ncbi:MAG TPA: MYXO-CTERM sorting domain-containing protein [Myxococcaceae bacterium]|nr:MYXO-CTERM sorting domain-containing protein [Myxococcaceae bacterium]
MGMRTMFAMRLAPFLLGLLVAGGALAEPDTFGLGTGRNGARLVDAPDTVINQYTRVTANVAVGARDLVVSDAGLFTVGGLVLLHQSSGLSPAPASGDQRPISLGTSPVGRFEYARVEAVTTSGLRLTAPLQYAYTANLTQVVSVPEYTALEVRPGATLRAAPWDGSRGGILAALISGTLRNDGLVSVDGAGFRGGAYVDHPSLSDCTGLDVPPTDGGAYKGEGVVAGRFGTASGRGNLANGGGGGNCHNAGGGGGGHAGAGGAGGYGADGGVDAGGLGGAPVGYPPFLRLTFGGGGGAGEGNNGFGTSGAAGGGVMLLRAAAVVGTGSFSAAGASAGDTLPVGDDGAGGGGAGGAISIRTFQGLSCAVAGASGGAGGDMTSATTIVGPGGGGGGGVIFLQGETINCPTQVLAGPPGVSLATGNSSGAGPAVRDAGTAYGFEQTVLLPFQLPSTPTLIEPANGATGVARRPRFKGTAEPGVVVHLLLDDRPYVQLGAGTDGAFQYDAPADLAPGPHQVAASTEVLGVRSLSSPVHSFSIVTPADAGTPDAGSPDAGVPDAGVPDGGAGPVQPVLVVPAEGEGVDPTPVFAGTSPSGVSVSIDVNDVEVARVPKDDQGRFRYELTREQALSPGPHRVTVHARDKDGNPGPASATTQFEVLPPTDLAVGCGCGASPGAGAGAVLLLGAWAAARRRRKD